MDWVDVLMFVGYVFEAVGLLAAALGLRQTWKDNAEGPFPVVPAPVERAWRKVLRRKPEPVTGTLHITSPAGTVSATANVERVTIGQPTLEERVAELEAELRKVQKRAEQAHGRIDKEQRARERDVESLGNRVQVVEEQAQRFTRRLIVEGVPTAARGLFFAFVGLLVQAVAGLLQ